MIKKTLTFNDLDGNPVQKDYYFHLNKGDLVDLQLSEEGGLSDKLRKVVESKDGALIIKTFKDLLIVAVGEKSEDNISFIKSERVKEQFQYSEALSAILMELLTNPGAALEFVKGVMPGDLIEKADLAELEALATSATAETLGLPEPVVQQPARPTRKELTEMSREELIQAFKDRQEM